MIAWTEPSAVIAYTDAPKIATEVLWLSRQRVGSPGEQTSREFWLRKAAVMDRIALGDCATIEPEITGEAVHGADVAAFQLIEYETAHRGLSPRGMDLVLAADYREYVRAEYHAWSLAQAC